MPSFKKRPEVIQRRQSSVKIALILILLVSVTVLGAVVYGYALRTQAVAPSAKGVPSDPATGGAYWQFFVSYSSVMSYPQAVSLMHARAANATVYAENNTVVFRAQTGVVYVFAMGEVFVIDGLVNPVLVVPRGATLEVVLVNLDSTESHDFAVTTLAPPYSQNPMNDVFAKQSTLQAQPFVPPVNGFSVHVFSKAFIFRDSGVYWYLCLYPGCAALGMYGEIIVR